MTPSTPLTATARPCPLGGTINATTDEFYDNLERIKAMEKNYNATLLFGHDIDQILDWAGQGVID